jgi:hypothetical protein
MVNRPAGRVAAGAVGVAGAAGVDADRGAEPAAVVVTGLVAAEVRLADRPAAEPPLVQAPRTRTGAPSSATARRRICDRGQRATALAFRR